MCLTSYGPYESVTSERTRIARHALRGSLELRMKLRIPFWRPVCVYDLAKRAGIEVKFCQEKSLGGMYDNASKTILIPAFRPAGRQSFTCAHELAHWYFGHGVSVDEIYEIDNWHAAAPKELIANHFAAGLLMPSKAVERIFTVRGWDISCPTDIQTFVAAGQLGVGYSTLVNHLYWSMNKIVKEVFDRLDSSQPKHIRARLLGHENSQHLVVADRYWEAVAIDLAIGDVALLPPGTKLAGCRNIETCSYEVAELAVVAVQSGICRVTNAEIGWSSYVRVCRKNYCGRSSFRHLEEVTDDNR